MFHRVSSKSKRGRVAIEHLEGRRLLSVSASVLAGPVAIANNSWTYALTGGSGGGGTETLTSKGLVTRDNGQQQIEVDVVDSSPGFPDITGKNYYGFDSTGYELYEDYLIGSTGTKNDTVDSPPELVLPGTLNANVPVTGAPSTETTTVTQADGTSDSSTDTVTTTNTLVSDTPNASISAGGKTYTCYEVDTTQVNATSDSSETDMSQNFIDPSVGLVEIKDLTNGTTLLLSNFVGTSYHLAATAVTNPLVDDAINPAVQVSLVDATGATDTKAEDAVTITASIAPASTGTGTLKGNLTATTVSGVATFTGLSIDKPGQYILKFTDGNGRSVPTNSFQVAGGNLMIVHPIKNGIVGGALKPAIEVELKDNKGKLITDAAGLVTLNIGGVNAGGPITGNTATMVRGIALFSSVKLAKEGEYTLTPTDDQGDSGTVSNTFEMTGLHLAFKKIPKQVGVNEAVKYIIQVEDYRNRLVNVSSIGLTFTLAGGDPTAVINHAGDTIDFGTANNSDRTAPLSISKPGTYTLTATVITDPNSTFEYTIDPKTSDEFQVVANHLQVVKSPHTTYAGIALRYQVVIKDFQKHIVTTNGDNIKVTLIPFPGAPGATLSGGTDSFLAGMADNGANTISVDTPGTYKLMFVDVPSTVGDPVADSAISGPFSIRQPK